MMTDEIRHAKAAVMTDEDRELLAIIESAKGGVCTDRKLLGRIVTKPYMVAGMFLPVDPEQAEQALIHGTGVVLWRHKPLPAEKEEEMFNCCYAISKQRQKSINEVWLDSVQQLIRDLPPQFRGETNVLSVCSHST
jgi:hypothetical protein